MNSEHSLQINISNTMYGLGNALENSFYAHIYGLSCD
jgi:hypothetical protein